MKNKLVFLIRFTFSICFLLSVFSPNRTIAATKHKYAINEYKKMLTDANKVKEVTGIDYGVNSNEKFALIDINNDKIPELLFTADNGYHLYVISYIEHEIKKVGNGFSGSEKYYPNKKIYYSQIQLSQVYGAIYNPLKQRVLFFTTA